MSYTGGVVESLLLVGESGPTAAPHIRAYTEEDGPTSEPISLRWKDLAINEILDIAVTRSREGWDGFESRAISTEAACRALELIKLAPERMSPPEIVPSPDGEIAFEWRSERKRILSLIPDGNELIYAAILGPKNNRESGCKPISSGWPERVLEILSRYFPNARSSSISYR